MHREAHAMLPRYDWSPLACENVLNGQCLEAFLIGSFKVQTVTTKL